MNLNTIKKSPNLKQIQAPTNDKMSIKLNEMLNLKAPRLTLIDRLYQNIEANKNSITQIIAKKRNIKRQFKSTLNLPTKKSKNMRFSISASKSRYSRKGHTNNIFLNDDPDVLLSAVSISSPSKFDRKRTQNLHNFIKENNDNSNKKKTKTHTAWLELAQKIQQLEFDSVTVKQANTELKQSQSQNKIIKKDQNNHMIISTFNRCKETYKSHSQLSIDDKSGEQPKTKNCYFKDPNKNLRFSNNQYNSKLQYNYKIYERAKKQYSLKNGNKGKKTFPNFFKKINKRLNTVQ